MRPITHFCWLLLLALPLAALAQGVGIGTTAPDASAALDITATAKGALLPRLTAAQRTGITAPATGLLVYQADAAAGFYYNAGTPAAPAWTRLTTGTGWSLSGNAGTDSTANYLGTTDAKPLRLGTGGQELARLHPNGALWLGGAPRASGYSGLLGNHLLLGYQAGKKLAASTIVNHFVGYQAGLHTTTGSFNHFVGFQAGYANTEGEGNHFEGFQAGYRNTTGYFNQFVGTSAGYSNTTGRDNYFSGETAGNANSTGDFNQFIGQFSGQYNTTGSQNHFSGFGSGGSNVTGSQNHFEGYGSGESNNGGNYNTFVGYQSGRNSTGSNNQFVGYKSGYSNSTGGSNVFSGYQSGYSNTTGGSNVFAGFQSGYANTRGSNNQFSGYGSGDSNTTGNYNTFEGTSAGTSNTIGGNNTFVGYASGYNSATGSNNTALGSAAGAATANLYNATALGYNALVDTNDKVRLGNTSVVTIEGQVAYSHPSDARFKYDVRANVPGLAFIARLRPVTYRFDAAQLDAFTRTGALGPGRADKSAAVQSGFLAQEVETAARSLGYAFDGLRVPASAREHYGLAYSQFVVPLVRAVQEQQAQIEALQTQLATDHAALLALQARVARLLGEEAQTRK